jgi:hypothetical protein
MEDQKIMQIEMSLAAEISPRNVEISPVTKRG